MGFGLRKGMLRNKQVKDTEQKNRELEGLERKVNDFNNGGACREFH